MGLPTRYQQPSGWRHCLRKASRNAHGVLTESKISADQGDSGSEPSRAVFVWRFGAPVFDERTQSLMVDGVAQALELRPVEVLAHLLRHAGETVTREELIESVWQTPHVTDGVLANAVNKLRKALGDDSASLIVTQHRVGYRLAVPVKRELIRVEPVGMSLSAGEAVPGRAQFVLKRRLGVSKHAEVWLAQHEPTKAPRVFKCSPDGWRSPR